MNPPNIQPQNVFDMVENGVCVWERTKMEGQARRCHLRYYGFAPFGLFLHGFGLWPVAPGESHSVQVSEI